MKISRQKKINKYLNFFVNNFGFHAPYQVLIDGTYCFAALKNQHNIQDQLPKYFQNELKLLTTPCIILETEKLGSQVFGAMLIVKKFATHKCMHTGKPVSGSACIKSMIGTDNRYIVATQDRELQDYVRGIPGVPLLYLHQKTPVLEQPSAATMDAAKNNIEMRFGLSKTEADVLSDLRKKSGIIEPEVKFAKRRKKGGPNPLSCKKKTKKPVHAGNVEKNSAENKVGKHRKRVRIPEHVKQELLKKSS